MSDKNYTETPDALARGYIKFEAGTASQSQAVPSELASLPPERITELANEHDDPEYGLQAHPFARAIEAEVQSLFSHSAATGNAAPAVLDLPGAIMNIPCRRKDSEFNKAADRLLYKEGHRDARHDAADLVLERADELAALASPAAPLAGKAEPVASEHQEPVAYMRWWARQYDQGHGNIGHDEGFEVCESRDRSDDGKPAFPVYACPPAEQKGTPESMANSNARFAIDGAIMFGREGVNKPPSEDHWLYEYWSIGQQLAKLGETSGWDNVTLVSAPLAAAVPAEEAMPLSISAKEGGRGLPPLPEMHVIVTEKAGFRFESRGFTDKQMHDYARAAIAASIAPAEPAPILASALTDEDIQKVATDAVRAGDLIWAGFSKDDNERYTIPVLSPADFKLSRAIEREVLARLSKPTAPVAADAAVTAEPASIDTEEFWRVMDTWRFASPGIAALDASDSVVEFINRHIAAQAPAGRDAQQWISVDERLPDVPANSDRQFIIACRRANGKTYVFAANYLNALELDTNDDGENVFTGWYTEGEHSEYSSWYEPVCQAGDEVTHWMPLPAAPHAVEQTSGGA